MPELLYTSKIAARGDGTTSPSKIGPAGALEEIGFDVWAGEFVALLGASGRGKETLLSTLSGLTPAISGNTLQDDAPLEGPGPDRSALFQDYACSHGKPLSRASSTK